MPRFASWLVLAACMVIASCDRGLPRTIQVQGRVTFDGQSPPAAGTVNFLPIEAADGSTLRPATGDFGKDGAFTAYSFNPGDGLMPGKYRMQIECWEVAPNMDGKPTKSFVPEKYQSATTSGFELILQGDSASQTIALDVKTK